MAPLPPVNGVTSIRFISENPTFEGGETWYARWSTGPPSAADVMDFANTIGAVWAATFKDDTPADAVLREIVVTDLSSSTGAREVFSPNVGGTNANYSDTSSMCTVVTFIESVRYRGGHPRKYHWPIPQQSTVNDREFYTGWLASILAKYTTLYDQINAYVAPSTATTTVVNVHYYSGHALLTPPHVHNVTGLSVQPRICSQRRRLGKLGTVL